VSPAEVRVDGASKRFGAVVAVEDASVDVPAGEVLALLGPSGCGKTTLLRLVGGFETPDAGRVRIGGEDVTRRPPQARPTAMVFQSYALFPTMTVGENVGYGLTVRRRPRAEVRARVGEALARVGLHGLEERPVARLSGGQQQRVALARALAVEPRVLLFDEPLSNLDPELREATRAEVKALLRGLGTTALWVTHDRAEALALADRLAVMRAGRVVESGTPEALYAEPATAFVARFLAGANVVEDAALAGRLAGAPPPPGAALAVGPDALVPHDAAAADGGGEGAGGAVPARLVGRLFQGAYAEWAVEAEPPGGGAAVPLRLWVEPGLAPPERLLVRAARWRWVAASG
jgi:ABC-type Fe3+/spermidine/putrescine transport system ATPase subunit